MNNFKKLVYLVIPICVLMVVGAGIAMVLKRVPVASEKITGTVQPYPAPSSVIGGEPTPSTPIVPYPAPGSIVTPEKTIATSRPPACTFFAASRIPEPTALAIDSLQFSAPRVIYSSQPGIGIVDWLPNSERLLITNNGTNNSETLEVINYRSGEAKVAAQMIPAGGKPVWLDEIKSVAYSSNVQGHAELWISNTETGASSRISSSLSGWSLGGNGKKLVYFSLDNGEIPQVWDASTNLAHSTGVDLAPWKYKTYPGDVPQSRPGRTFVAVLNPSGTKTVFHGRSWFFVLEINTKQVCEVDLGTQRGMLTEVLQAKWSPDGRYLALVTTGSSFPGELVRFSNVTVLDMLTGKQYKPTLSAPFVYDIAWSNNNQFLAVLGANQNAVKKGIARSNIYLMAFKENDSAIKISDELFGGGTGDGWQLAWSPDNRKIALKCPIWNETAPLIPVDRICVFEVSSKP